MARGNWRTHSYWCDHCGREGVRRKLTPDEQLNGLSLCSDHLDAFRAASPVKEQ